MCKEHTVNAASYLALLKKTVGRRAWKKQRFWQQDNARPHVAAPVKEWLAANVQCLESWPANSPDLSPIENLWGCMWRDALKCRPTTSEKLWESVQKTFREYPDEFIIDTKLRGLGKETPFFVCTLLSVLATTVWELSLIHI